MDPRDPGELSPVVRLAIPFLFSFFLSPSSVVAELGVGANLDILYQHVYFFLDVASQFV